jgi:hypothetical protein
VIRLLSTPDEFQPSGTSTTAHPPKPSSKRKILPRPCISISASGTSGQLKGFEQLQKPKDSKTARQTIFDSGGVGTDLRAPSRKNVVTSASASTSFMKPAGVRTILKIIELYLLLRVLLKPCDKSKSNVSEIIMETNQEETEEKEIWTERAVSGEVLGLI